MCVMTNICHSVVKYLMFLNTQIRAIWVTLAWADLTKCFSKQYGHMWSSDPRAFPWGGGGGNPLYKPGAYLPVGQVSMHWLTSFFLIKISAKLFIGPRVITIGKFNRFSQEWQVNSVAKVSKELGTTGVLFETSEHSFSGSREVVWSRYPAYLQRLEHRHRQIRPRVLCQESESIGIQILNIYIISLKRNVGIDLHVITIVLFKSLKFSIS